ncbi:hypothetical protein ElyMa_005730600 [Elysia marginata]|uniref:Uncharacterized protein n=1 Tax=Elysia marginata TaxID=1093978 RepID=A0AAV4FJ66_9GAST|nr:hypothetical protein ElyMa_005730600 [Elysia marginata]
MGGPRIPETRIVDGDYVKGGGVVSGAAGTHRGRKMLLLLSITLTSAGTSRPIGLEKCPGRSGGETSVPSALVFGSFRLPSPPSPSYTFIQKTGPIWPSSFSSQISAK